MAIFERSRFGVTMRLAGVASIFRRVSKLSCLALLVCPTLRSGQPTRAITTAGTLLIRSTRLMGQASDTWQASGVAPQYPAEPSTSAYRRIIVVSVHESYFRGIDILVSFEEAAPRTYISQRALPTQSACTDQQSAPFPSVLAMTGLVSD